MGIKNEAGYFKNDREIHSFAKTDGQMHIIKKYFQVTKLPAYQFSL